MRRRRPLIITAHKGDDTAGGIGRGLERLAVPLHQRGLNVLALRPAVQHPADGIAVMGKIGVQPYETVARFVDSRDRVPGRRRRLAVDAQIALASALDYGMADIDRHVLALAAAQFPDFGGCEASRGNACLGGSGNAERGRQLRLVPAQLDGVERGRIAADRRPDIGEDFCCTLHYRSPFLNYSVFEQSMPSDLIRGWTPVRVAIKLAQIA